MSILGVWTNAGLDLLRDTQINNGWKIEPTRFAVSETQGILDPSRVAIDGSEFYSAPFLLLLLSTANNSVSRYYTYRCRGRPSRTTRDSYLCK